jgi:hypothetical protein
MYLAFLKRYQFDMANNHDEVVNVDWRGDYGELFEDAALPTNINDATSSLVYIARHGKYNRVSTSCTLLEWDS